MRGLSVVIWVASFVGNSKGKTCHLPELPRFSNPITMEYSSYGEDAHFYYGCLEGYHFEQRTTVRHKIVCLNGHWNPPNFWKCVDDCGNKCVHGKCVRTIGSSTATVSTCQCDRNYAGVNCDARVCEKRAVGPHHQKPFLKDGTLKTDKYSLGSVIMFKCVANYVIKKGHPFANCRSDGWHPAQVPTCEENTCPMHIFEKGIVLPEMHKSYKNGDIINLQCDPGFRLVGESHISCRHGYWSTKWPSCEDYTCVAPPLVYNAHQIIRNKIPFTVGSAVTYQCNQRYYMEGGRTIKCVLRYNSGPVWQKPPRCYSVSSCGDKNKVIVKRDDGYLCESKVPVITTTVSSTVKPLTIVTATAGALLLLLLIVISLVAYQRRRIAIINRRQGRERLNNEDERYSFVYYSNDVHVVLPSYDEAMRVQGAPPPYGSDATAGSITDGSDLGRQEVSSGVSSSEASTEVIYDVIDDTLRLVTSTQPQTLINEAHCSANDNNASDNSNTRLASNDTNACSKPSSSGKSSNAQGGFSDSSEDVQCSSSSSVKEEDFGSCYLVSGCVISDKPAGSSVYSSNPADSVNSNSPADSVNLNNPADCNSLAGDTAQLIDD